MGRLPHAAINKKVRLYYHLKWKSCSSSSTGCTGALFCIPYLCDVVVLLVPSSSDRGLHSFLLHKGASWHWELPASSGSWLIYCSQLLRFNPNFSIMVKLSQCPWKQISVQGSKPNLFEVRSVSTRFMRQTQEGNFKKQRFWFSSRHPSDA